MTTIRERCIVEKNYLLPMKLLNRSTQLSPCVLIVRPTYHNIRFLQEIILGKEVIFIIFDFSYEIRGKINII